MSLMDFMLDGLVTAVKDYSVNSRIPRTLPMDVITTFHHCEVEQRARQMMSAHLLHSGRPLAPRMETLGDLLEFGKLVSENGMYLRDVFQTLEQTTSPHYPPPNLGDGRKVADVKDATFQQFSAGAIVGVVHISKRLEMVSMKALYGATISDIWQTVEAAFGAIRRLEEWREPVDPLPHAHFGLFDLHADGARDEADVEYWRDRLIYAIGARTTYFDNVVPMLDGVVDRLREEERKSLEEARKKLGDLIGLIGGDIGAGVVKPEGVDDTPWPPPLGSN